MHEDFTDAWQRRASASVDQAKHMQLHKANTDCGWPWATCKACLILALQRTCERVLASAVLGCQESRVLRGAVFER